MYLDTAAQKTSIHQKVLDGFRAIFPIADKNRELELTDIQIRDTLPTLAAQRRAIVAGDSLTIPVYGSFRFKVNGQTVDETTVKILDLPVITHRGTFVVQGKDYSVFHQARLRPGVYTTKVEDSDTVTARFNLAKGLGFRLALSDDASVFYVVFDASKSSGGQAKVPLYSLLKALGAGDEEIKHRWGDKLYASNVAKSDVLSDTKRLQQLVVYEKNRTANEVADVRRHFESTVLDADTTKVSLGRGYDHVTAQALLDATGKMVRVYNDDDAGDDMDSLLFKEILAAEDHLYLRITKGAREPNGVLTKMKRRMLTARNVRDIIPSGAFTPLIETFFTTSSLASPQTEINPIEILETNNKLTAMGEGGIQSEHGIPMSARNLHPSHMGFIDPVRTTESLRVGVDLRMAHNVKVRDRNMYAEFIDKSGKKVQLRPMDLKGKVIAFPGQQRAKIVRVLIDGEMNEVPVERVDYWMEKSLDMFTFTSAMVPFLHNDQGNRVTMASRMVTQALPLVNREQPFVQIKTGDDKSLEQDYAHRYFCPAAPEDGVVTAITADRIQLNGKLDVEIYNNFPMNYKTLIHMEPTVKVGDRVHKGQLLAESNFTKGGALALGTNMRVAYVPYKGWNHEDGIVISETAAKKLTSMHMFVKELETGPDIIVDKQRFTSLFPSKITPEQLRKLDNDGVIKVGETVNRDDFLATAMAKRDMTSSDKMLERFGRGLANPYKDVSITWDHDRPGTITDVIREKDLVKVVVRTVDEARVGDKVTGRHGNKGTVTLIMPDNEMPYTADKKPVDMLLNPAGVISRVNPGQLYETMAGKLAEKSGKPYLVENFSPEDSSKKVLGELSKHGLAPEETLIDPKTNKPVGQVFVGNQYTLKLHKQTEGNFGARFTRGYDVNLQPAKGGEEGAKAMGLLDFYALLGHNARNVLHEVTAYKGQKNEEFWDAVKLGLPVPAAKEPFAFHKFKAVLGATGINVKKEDGAYSVMPLTDKDVAGRSFGKVRAATMAKGSLDAMIAEDGGLFDEKTTGGLKGENWTHVDLAEPIVNPMFEKVVKALLGNTDITKMTGAEVKEALAKIDAPTRIVELKSDLAAAKGTKRDKLLKELRYLAALQKMKLKPDEYVLTKFPVLPPVYRPIYPAANGKSPMVSDLNYLYRDLINVNNELHAMADFPHDEKEPLRKALQQAAGAVVGVTEPISVKSKKQELKGALKVLTGTTAKDGFFHRKIMYRTQDLAGRGTILPDPSLHIDECKLPAEMMYQLYKPFLIKNLVSKGLTPVQATREVQDETAAAARALEEERNHRPVLLNRAPTLHKYNILALKPIPIEGKSIFIPPLIIKGYNADFDGDSVSGDTWVVVQTDEGAIQLRQIRDVQ